MVDAHPLFALFRTPAEERTPGLTLSHLFTHRYSQGIPRTSSKRGNKTRDFRGKVEPLARIVLVAGFEAFNLPLYREVVSSTRAAGVHRHQRAGAAQATWTFER